MTSPPPAQQPLQNLYHRRLVADDRQRPCYICHKSTPVVLITPDQRDFFYACAGHLADRGFATPADGTIPPASDTTLQEDERKKKNDELQKEIERVVKEYEDKQKRRKERRKKKKKEERDKDGKRVKDDDDDFSDGDEEKEANDKEKKVKELESKKSSDGEGKAESGDDGQKDDDPGVFVLQKSIFAMRVNRTREMQAAKRRQEQMRSGNFFPSVPRGGLS